MAMLILASVAAPICIDHLAETVHFVGRKITLVHIPILAALEHTLIGPSQDQAVIHIARRRHDQLHRHVYALYVNFADGNTSAESYNQQSLSVCSGRPEWH